MELIPRQLAQLGGVTSAGGCGVVITHRGCSLFADWACSAGRLRRQRRTCHRRAAERRDLGETTTAFSRHRDLAADARTAGGAGHVRGRAVLVGPPAAGDRRAARSVLLQGAQAAGQSRRAALAAGGGGASPQRPPSVACRPEASRPAYPRRRAGAFSGRRGQHRRAPARHSWRRPRRGVSDRGAPPDEQCRPSGRPQAYGCRPVSRLSPLTRSRTRVSAWATTVGETPSAAASPGSASRQAPRCRHWHSSATGPGRPFRSARAPSSTGCDGHAALGDGSVTGRSAMVWRVMM